MRKFGISVYPDFYDLDVIKEYILKAKKLGASRIYTCMLLKDYNFIGGVSSQDSVFPQLFQFCLINDIEIAVDTNEKVFADYGATYQDLKPFYQAGIKVLRIDGGFTSKEIVHMTNNEWGIKIEYNASFINFDNKRIHNEVISLFNELESHGNLQQFCACFNFYPRPETGHALKYVKQAVHFLKRYNIEILAFIPSQYSPNDLLSIGYGIPTIESHRSLPCAYSSQELYALGVQTVLFADSMADESELRVMQEVIKKDYLEIPCVFNEFISNELKNEIDKTIFDSRGDSADHVLRCMQLRNFEIKPCSCGNRKQYDITIDNINSARYKGEIQILLTDLGYSTYANIIGMIHPYGRHLLPYLKDEANKFCISSYTS